VQREVLHIATLCKQSLRKIDPLFKFRHTRARMLKLGNPLT